MTENLRRLKELVPNLSNFVVAKDAEITEYNLEAEGSCFGINLWHSETVAAQRAFMSKGSKFPQHTHKVIEHLVVYEGKLAVAFEREAPRVLLPGDSIRIEPEVPHHVEALEDTWMVGITIPPGKGYPGARQQ